MTDPTPTQTATHLYGKGDLLGSIGPTGRFFRWTLTDLTADRTTPPATGLAATFELAGIACNTAAIDTIRSQATT